MVQITTKKLFKVLLLICLIQIIQLSPPRHNKPKKGKEKRENVIPSENWNPYHSNKKEKRENHSLIKNIFKTISKKVTETFNGLLIIAILTPLLYCIIKLYNAYLHRKQKEFYIRCLVHSSILQRQNAINISNFMTTKKDFNIQSV